MANFKCKFCGSDIVLPEGQSTTLCDVCGSHQTVPAATDLPTLNRFARANRLRLACEFDKAAGIYESIVADFPEEPEGYWGLVLCKYGVVYRADPASGRNIPVCCRASFDSVMEDTNFEQAMENAGPAARRIYREEAKQLEVLRKNLLAAAGNEPSCDIFLCCLASDERGSQTRDFLPAGKLARILADRGYDVFFPHNTMDPNVPDNESAVFAALHSAKIMLVFGTDYEYFNAVWVKNQWSRFLQLMAKDRTKHMIPCFRGIDAYDMPKEFGKLTAQDLGKAGAVEALLSRIAQLLSGVQKTPAASPVTQTPVVAVPVKETPVVAVPVKETPVVATPVPAPVPEAPAPAAEDRREAVYIRASAMMKAAREAAYREAAKLFDSIADYKDSAALAEDCRDRIRGIREKAECARKDALYQEALSHLQSAKAEEDYLRAAELFESVPDWQDAAMLAQQCREKAECARKDALYQEALSHLLSAKAEEDYLRAAELFESVPDWQDAAMLAQQCREKAELSRKDAIYQQAIDKLQKVKTPKGYRRIAELFDSVSDHGDAADLARQCREKAEAMEKDAAYTDAKNRMAGTQLASWQEALKRLEPIADWKDSAALMDICRKKITELEAQQEIRQKKEAVRTGRKKILLPIAAAVLAVAAAAVFFLVPLLKYNEALALMEEGKYEEAIAAFEAMDGYRDSEEKIKDCNAEIIENQYLAAVALMEEGKYEEAVAIFRTLGMYKDSAQLIKECDYRQAARLAEAGSFLEAEEVYLRLRDYKDSADKAIACRRSYYDRMLDTATRRGDITEAAIFYYSIGETQKALEVWDRVNSRKTLEAGGYHTVGLLTNGTVVAVGNNYDGWCKPISPGQCDVSGWRDIISISSVGYHTVGLKRDHTVVATGLNTDGQCNVSEWTDIVDIATGREFTVGLKADGTVVYAGNGEDVDDTKQWENIMAIDAGRDFVVGLKTDGTIVCTYNYSINPTNVIAIAASDFGLTCLSEDGTVTSTFKKLGGLKNVARIYSGSYAAIAIMSSGEIVIDGDFVESSYMHLSQWDLLKSGDLLAFSSNSRHAVILQPWGNIRSYGESGWSRLNVQHWHDIEVPRP